MDFTLPARILAVAAAGGLALPTSTPLPRPGPLDPSTVAALEALADAELEAQRAGAFEADVALDSDQVDRLTDAQDSAPELELQRGGDIHLTDREVQIVLWTAAVIAVILIVA